MISTVPKTEASTEEIRRVLTKVNAVLSQAKKYSGEKAREAEEAKTRCRALERVIIEGKIGNADQLGEVAEDGTSGERKHGWDLVQSAVKKARFIEREKVRDEFSATIKEKEALEAENIELKRRLKAAIGDRDKTKTDMGSIVEAVKVEAAAEWQAKLDSGVRAECSRMKAWARGVIDRKEIQFKKRIEEEIAKNSRELSSQFQKQNRTRSLSVAREASVEERIKQRVKRQVEKVKQNLELDLDLLQKELDATKSTLKAAQGERDALKAESRNHRRKLAQKIDKVTKELRLEYAEKSKRTVAEHRQGIAKLLRKSSDPGPRSGGKRSNRRDAEELSAVKPPRVIKLAVNVNTASPSTEYSSSLIASPTPSTPGGFEDCED